jgi:DNA-binding phage protein
MMDIEKIKLILKDRNLKAVALGAGIHYNALYRMMSGGTQPKYETVKKLTDYIESQNNG